MDLEAVDCDIFMRHNNIACYLYPRHVRFFDIGHIVTLKLNCDDNTLEFYHPDHTEKIEKINIEKDQSWYFIARLCAKRDWCDFQVIDDCDYDPINLIQ